MVAFHYPPSGAVASQRPFKFARYLPESGWEPVLVARRPDRRQPHDPSFAGLAEPALRLNPLEPAMALRLLPGRLVNRVKRWLLLPDDELGWMGTLAAILPSLIRRFRPNVLWANSVPTGSLVAAAWASRRARCPLVIDFHNEWTRNMYYRPATRWHDAAHRALEEFVVRQAAGVTTLNPLHTEDLRARFPGVRAETIENGFDPEDYAVDPPRPRMPLVFTYAGAVYGYQSPRPFLQALAETGIPGVEVRVVGDRFSQFVPGSWPFPVSVRGHVDHRELGRIFSESSAFFLCLEPPAARQLPAKLYEYLRAGRPTFAICPRGGAAERWLAATGAGASVPSEEPGRWSEALRGFIGGLETFHPPAGEAFHRRTLTRRLAAILDAAASRLPRPSIVQ